LLACHRCRLDGDSGNGGELPGPRNFSRCADQHDLDYDHDSCAWFGLFSDGERDCLRPDRLGGQHQRSI
jgi:hypothetical protein